MNGVRDGNKTRGRWRMVFVLSVLAFAAFQVLQLATHDVIVRVMAAAVSLVYLVSAVVAFRKASGRG